MEDIVLPENEQEFLNGLCVKDKDGQIAIMIGLIATVYFERPCAREVREAVADAAEQYIDEFRSYLRWTTTPDGSNFRSIDSGSMPSPRKWLPAHPDGQAWEFSFHGGATRTAASPFHVSAFGSDSPHSGLGYFHITLPLLWYADHAGNFQNYVLSICKRIKPLSGYGGLGVVESPHSVKSGDFQPVVRTLAERFPGLEIERRPRHTNHLRQGIKGVNWLTILGDRWLTEIGGLDDLRVRLGEAFSIYPYPGGVVIQAGPRPEIGDANANRYPVCYVTLARVLKKLRIKDHYPFHFGGPGRLDYEASNAWLARFDDK